MIKVLDCTLRDGGYYNNWDFDTALVEKYLKCMKLSKVDFVELGMRSLKVSGYKGPWAYTKDSYLKRIELPVGPKYGVMIDAKDVVDNADSTKSAIDQLFCIKEHSSIDFVRVATHYDLIDECKSISEQLKSKGYLVCLNLMQSAGKEASVLKEVSAKISRWNSVDVLYFADSLGNMDRIEVERIYTALASEWNGPIGFHAHNNMGLAVSNCLAAKSIGVDWLDATVSGMGRGAGNAEVESLLGQLAGFVLHDSLMELAVNEFSSLKDTYGWGANPAYLYAALNSIHPTYVQKLLTVPNSDKNKKSIYHVMQLLKHQCSYSDDRYLNACGSVGDQSEGNEAILNSDEKAINLFQRKRLLVVANSESTRAHRTGIELFIEGNDIDVVAINVVKCIDPVYVDYYCISHNERFEEDKNEYLHLKKPLILPRNRFSFRELEYLLEGQYINYAMSPTEKDVEINASGCKLKNNLTLNYILALAVLNHVTEVFLVGFEGYEDPSRNKEVNESIFLYRERFGLSLTALTPTKYTLNEDSLYRF